MNREVEAAVTHTSLTYLTLMTQSYDSKRQINPVRPPVNEHMEGDFCTLTSRRCTPVSASVKKYPEAVEGGDAGMWTLTWMMLHLDITPLISLCTLLAKPLWSGSGLQNKGCLSSQTVCLFNITAFFSVFLACGVLFHGIKTCGTSVVSYRFGLPEQGCYGR